MGKEKKQAILGVVIAVVTILTSIIIVYTHKEDVPHYIATVPAYIVDEISNQEVQYYGKDLPETYEIVIAKEKYKGKLVDAYFSTEYCKDVCVYMCEDNTIMRFVCDAGGLEFLSIDFGIPARIFKENSEEHIKDEIMNSIWEGDKQYVFDVIKENKHINYNYIRYIDNVETLEGINLVMNETGEVYSVSKYIMRGNAQGFDLAHMSDSDDSLKEYLEKEYGKDVKYEIVKKQISYAGPVDSTINYHIRINGGTEVKKYQVMWGYETVGDIELGENCS